MAATISRGKTFGSTETVTNTKLHQLVDSATLSNLDDSTCAAAFGLTVKGTSTPTNNNDIWIDTNCSPPVVKKYDGANWTPVAGMFYLLNNSGGSLSAGDVVVPDSTTASAVTTTTVVGTPGALVAMQSISSGASGVFGGPGADLTNVSVNGAVTKGQYLKTHSVAKQAVATSTVDAGVFAIALSSQAATGALSRVIMIGGVGGFTPSSSNALSGSVLQVLNNLNVAMTTVGTAIPYDDTIPQITEGGSAGLSQAITPSNTNNKILVRAVVCWSNNTGSTYNTIALFQDSNANALACTTIFHGATTQNPQISVLEFFMTAGTTSSTTFTIRIGDSAGNTITLNGVNGARKYGGVLTSSLTVMEIKA